MCAACRNGAREVSKTALEAMRRMLLLSDSEMQRVRLTAPLRKEIEAMLLEQTAHSLEYGSTALAFYRDLAN